MPSGDVFLYAHKESEGYPDQVFAFFATGNRSWISSKVEVRRVTQGVTIQLGEKAAYLNIEITDEKRTRLAGGLTFTRNDQPGHYQSSTSGAESIMVPPVPFRLTVEVPGYEPWHYGGENWQSNSGLITLKSGQSLNLDIRLKRAQ